MVVDEAHIAGIDYSSREVEILPISEFRDKYGDIPIKRMLQSGPFFTSREDTSRAAELDSLEGATARCIPFSDEAKFADAAVVFDRAGNPVVELSMKAVRGLGVFYMAGEPGEGEKRDGIARIYEHLEQNPIPIGLLQRIGRILNYKIF